MGVFVSLITPQGRGAVATVVVGGRDCTAYVSARFEAACGKPLDSLPAERIWFGRWKTPGTSGEELVVCHRSCWLEINCHGGIAAADAIVQQLVEDGCTELTWEQFAWQSAGNAFLAEARIALAQARTDRTAGILLDQLRGALCDQWQRMERAIEAGQSDRAIEHSERLLARSRVGLHLIEPYRVVLCGPPNVGKSTLINALLGYQRSIVFDQPGTTRDVLTAYTALGGWPVELSDTAGLRDDAVGVEAEGVQRSKQQFERADLLILVADASDENRRRYSEQAAPITSLVRDTPQLVVQNKIDLAGGKPGPGIPTSAIAGVGIAELAAAIVKHLVPDPPEPGVAVPFTRRQVRWLEAIRDTLSRADLESAGRMSLEARGFGNGESENPVSPSAFR
jgi:tRNA modification GTPase